MDDDNKCIKIDKFKNYKIVVIFAAIFFVLIFNIHLIPSVFDVKEQKIEKFINFLGYTSYYQPKCDVKCANNCLFTDKSSEETFKTCISSCNCSYTYNDNSGSSGFLIKFYFLFSIISSLSAIMYLKKHVLIQKYKKITNFLQTNSKSIENVNESEEPEYQKLISEDEEKQLNKINLINKI